MSEEKKYLDEEDVLEEEIQEKDSPSEEEPTEPESEVEKEEPSDEEVEDDESVEEESEKEDESWMEMAKAKGWVPDHVREKHAREAQTLRDQVRNLQAIVQQEAAQEEEIDPNEVVRHGDLDRFRQAMETFRDPAVLSEAMMRTQVADYDEVVVSYVEPIAEANPWLAMAIRQEHNPAAAAYKLGCALRDGRKVNFGFQDGRMIWDIEEEKPPTPKPKKKDPSRPPVEALEQAKKQPKSLDEVPSATGEEAAEMSVEDFWKLPTDTLIRLRTERPELYEKMRNKSHEKYG